MGEHITVTPNYEPNEKQVLLHNAPVSYKDIWLILYGGARGGGKSAGALADAFMFAQAYPGAKIVILRESLDSVRQSFLDKLPSLFPQESQGMRIYEYREKSSSWYPSRSVVFPNGSYITFQRVGSYEEATAKQGWEFHMMVIDEVTKQEERTFDYLLTTVRSTKVHNRYTGESLQIPTKVVLGCNPGGIGHKWVKRRFIDRCVVKYNEFGSPIQTRDAKEVVQHPFDKKDITTYIRFIPASVLDNKHVARSYVANLMKQPEHKKMMDLYGRWDIVAGRFFDLQDDILVSPQAVREDLKRFGDRVEIYIAIDWGYKPSYHSAHWYAIFPDKRVVAFKELYGQELIFEEFVQTIVDMSDGMNIEATCLPHDMFRKGDQYRDNTGRIIGQTKSDVFDYHGLVPLSIESGKGKVDMRMDKIHSALEIKTSDGVKKFRISRSCPQLIDELENAVHWDVDPTKIHPKSLDHAIDDYGLFLTFYSSDIELIEIEEVEEKPKTRLEEILERDEEMLEMEEQDDYYVGIDNDFYL